MHSISSTLAMFTATCCTYNTVAIGNPERHVRKASHRGTKQQQRSCSQSLLLLLARATYIVVLFFTHIPFVVNHTIKATPPERLQPGVELGGYQEGHCPPKKFSGLFLKVLHRPLTAPLVAKLAPPVAPPNENVWIRPWVEAASFC